MRISAGYSDPCDTRNTSRDICWMRCAIPQPCMGSRESVLSTVISRVPCSSSPGSPAIDLSPSDCLKVDRRIRQKVQRDFEKQGHTATPLVTVSWNWLLQCKNPRDASLA